MRGNKFEKSHIQILESETLSREYRVTVTVKRCRINPFMLAHGTPILPLVKTFILLFVCTLQECGKVLEGV